MITNNMLYALGDLAIGVSTPIVSHLALGSTDPITLAATDTSIQGEFSRLALSSATRSGTVIKYSTTRTAVAATSTPINSVGLFTSSSGGVLWAEMLIPSLVQTSNFDVDIDLWINLNGV